MNVVEVNGQTKNVTEQGLKATLKIQTHFKERWYDTGVVLQA